MKKIILYCFVLTFLLTGCSYVGCGRLQRIKDKAQYRSLTGKKGRLVIFYEGKDGIFADYPEVEITYSSSDNEIIWFKPKGEKEKYIQGPAFFEPKQLIIK